MKIMLLLKCILLLFAIAQAQISPPYTDYCEMLARDIQGKAHGFLAGNLMYYSLKYTTGFNSLEDSIGRFSTTFFID